MLSSIINEYTFYHFLLYLIFGIVIKNKYKLFLIIGIIWEIFEYIFSGNKFFFNLLGKEYFNKSYINKIIDIIFNILGYYIGNKIKIN
jgi:hypothetical protein